MTPRATIDFETRSTCSIRTCGSWRYSLDPTTEVLCLAFRLPYWEEGRTGLWHPAFPRLGIPEADLDDLTALFRWIVQDQGLVEAHNAWFERGIWQNICERTMHWTSIDPRQWRCSAAKAAAHALPRSLAGAADALCLEIRKDVEGAKTMKKMVSPRKPVLADWQRWGRQHAPCPFCLGTGRLTSWNKNGTVSMRGKPCAACDATGVQLGATLPPMPTLYHESRELMEALWAYCRTDVLTEEALSHALPDLSSQETQVYLLDQQMNEHGFAIDAGAVDTALTLLDGEFTTLNAELAVITGGEVTKATQRAKMLAWFAKQGLDLDDSQADTLDAELERGHPPHVTRALEVVRTLGKSSTAKFTAMQNWMCPDSRVHGGLVYHGATTGRWTGSGVQPHNFPRGGALKADQDTLWDYLNTQDRSLITEEFGSVMTALSEGLRGAIVAPPGRRLFAADFNAIEPRVLFWLAGDSDALDVFRSGRDIYNDFGTTELYRRPINRKVDVIEGILCKAAILGLGYGMGAKKFVETALALGDIVLPEDQPCLECDEPTGAHARNRADHDPVPEQPDLMTAVVVVQAYRRKYWKVPALWRQQEHAAIAAVRTRQRIQAGVVSWHVERKDIANSFLYCTLPSGRRLAYPGPSVVMQRTPWGALQPCLRYYEINQYNRQWQLRDSYGGLLVENCLWGETPVMTDVGWMRLCDIQSSQRIWDGEAWVRHGGVVSRGYQRTVLVDGVCLTPDHRVLTTEGWREAQTVSGLDWAPCQRPDRDVLCGSWTGTSSVDADVSTGPRPDATVAGSSPDQRCLFNVPRRSRTSASPSTTGVGQHAHAVSKSSYAGVLRLWRAGYWGLRAVATIRQFLGRHARDVSSWVNARPHRQQPGVLAGQLSMGHATRTASQYATTQPESAVPDHRDGGRDWIASRIQPVLPGPTVAVYDIVNCGPRNQFVVAGGRIVHNCTQAVARDLMAEATVRLAAMDAFTPVLTVHDEIIAEGPMDGRVEEFEAEMSLVPDWAPGLPVVANGWKGTRYHK